MGLSTLKLLVTKNNTKVRLTFATKNIYILLKFSVYWLSKRWAFRKVCLPFHRYGRYSTMALTQTFRKKQNKNMLPTLRHGDGEVESANNVGMSYIWRNSEQLWRKFCIATDQITHPQIRPAIYQEWLCVLARVEALLSLLQKRPHNEAPRN